MKYLKSFLNDNNYIFKYYILLWVSESSSGNIDGKSSSIQKGKIENKDYHCLKKCISLINVREQKKGFW